MRYCQENKKECAECASSRSVFIVWKRSFLYDKKAPPILQNIVMNILQNQRGSFIFYKSSVRCGALENSGLSCFIWNRLCKNHSQDALLPRFSLRQASTAVHRVCSDWIRPVWIPAAAYRCYERRCVLPFLPEAPDFPASDRVLNGCGWRAVPYDIP